MSAEPLNRTPSVSEEDDKSRCKLSHHEIDCPTAGKIDVFVQGTRSANEVVIMTVHDIGCDHHVFLEFVDHPKMKPIKDRTVWIHVNVPGQGAGASDLPADYHFPHLQAIGEDLNHVLDKLNVKEVVCFGEGAGANILARFAMANNARVLGIVLMHATGTTAGLFDMMKDKMMNWKLETVEKKTAVANYLVLHRFGTTKFSKANNNEELKAIVENYQEVLRTKTNPKNLHMFVEAFHKRTNIEDFIMNLKCPALLITGQHSVFNASTRSLHQAITKRCTDKTKVEFIEVAGVANVVEEKPDKLAESFQYFLQGLGLISSVPMHNVHKMLRTRTMSMEEYDKPMRERQSSVASMTPPASPGKQSPVSPTAVLG